MQKFGMALNTIRTEIQGKLPEGDKREIYSIKGLINSNREDLAEYDRIRMDDILSKYPKLKTAYELKEKLREVYNCKTKYDAFQMYYEWEKAIPKDAKEVKGIQKMINKLKKEIFAYFDGGWTNAFTECTNNLIRRIIRDGNGYSYEVLRAKVLYGTPASKKRIMKIKDMNFYEVFLMRKNDIPNEKRKFIQYGEKEIFNCYTDIDELIAIMDRGEF
jgi:hypothetical protein